MNRLWIGIAIMILFLAMGLGLLWGSNTFFQSFSRDMEQISAHALGANWADADKLLEKCQQKWETYRHFWASFTDHAPMEQMDTLLSQLDVYRRRQLGVEFAVVCNNISHLAQAIDESHSLCWWSVL